MTDVNGAGKDPGTPANTQAVQLADELPRDRVAMLSLRADGSADQHRPELIGDPDGTKAATEEQFRQQAVSATDDVLRRQQAVEQVETVEQDPAIRELQDAHKRAEEVATPAADATVDTLLAEQPATLAEATPVPDQAAGESSGSKSSAKGSKGSGSVS